MNNMKQNKIFGRLQIVMIAVFLILVFAAAKEPEEYDPSSTTLGQAKVAPGMVVLREFQLLDSFMPCGGNPVVIQRLVIYGFEDNSFKARGLQIQIRNAVVFLDEENILKLADKLPSMISKAKTLEDKPYTEVAYMITDQIEIGLTNDNTQSAMTGFIAIHTKSLTGRIRHTALLSFNDFQDLEELIQKEAATIRNQPKDSSTEIRQKH